MKFDIKAHLLSLAESTEVKTLVVDLVEAYAKDTKTGIDDTLARAVRVGLLGQ
jgi:hypothetical protein